MATITVSELQSYNLPVDLSGYSTTQLASLIDQASNWVNGECRHYKGFEAHRVLDRVYGRGTNRLQSTYFPVLALNGIKLIFPPNTGNVNLPGPNQVPIDASRVVVDHDAGWLINWSPFVFQTIGYMTVFPDGVPIDIDYYTGYTNTVVSTTAGAALSAGSTLIPVANASTFYYGQTVRFYEAGLDEQVLCLGTTQQGGYQFVIPDSPTQYTHQTGVTIGNLPPEVKLATAFVVCDFAVRSLNPENLEALRIDKVEKRYQKELTVRAKMNEVGSPQIETERPFIKEARRLLEHYYSDRGIN